MSSWLRLASRPLSSLILRRGAYPRHDRFRNKPLRIESLEERSLLATTAAEAILYRVNAGGPQLSDTVPWEEDVAGNPSSYTNAGAASSKVFTTGSGIDLSHASVPAGTPEELFQSERWDPTSGDEMQWSFPATPGNYDVRLYFADIYSGTHATGERVFDVVVEGSTVLDDYDIYARVGGFAGIVETVSVTSDASIDITMLHGVENPAIKAIEIVASAQPNRLGTSNDTLSFGPAPPSTQLSATLALRNLGQAGDPPIVVDPAATAISGPDAGLFGATFSSPDPITLDPGDSTNVTVSFNSPLPGTATAALQVAHSGDNSPLVIPLDGTALVSDAQAGIVVDPGGSLGSSTTYDSGSFSITNESPSGQKIERVRFDVTGALLPDQVFDPNSAAGDTHGKDFTPDSGAGSTGLQDHSFLGPHDGGFDILEITFDDFQSQESFTFSIDMDPTSINGSSPPGPEDSGSVSGLDLSGSSVTVYFDDGAVLQSELYRIAGSDTGSQSTLKETVPPAPGLEVLGIGATPNTVTDPQQTVRLTGPAGSEARLMVVEGALLTDGVPGGGFDLDPFEANKAIAVAEVAVSIGATGFVDVPVTLTKSHPDGGLNYLMAVLQDDQNTTGFTAKVVLQYDPMPASNQSPVLQPIADLSLVEGEARIINLSASDPDNDVLTLSAANLPPFVTFNDQGGGTGTLTITPAAGDAGTYQVTVTATDDAAPPLADSDSLTITVDAVVVTGGVVYRVNAGGPQLAGSPAWEADSGGSPSTYGNSGAAQSEAFSTSATVDTSHPSIPAGTPAALFQSERWDGGGGAEMQWQFPVTPGEYEVRLYLADIYSGTHSVGARVFDVLLEGSVVLDDYDIFAEVGGMAGVVKSFIVSSDGTLDIGFAHEVENPAVKGIEILSAAAPDTLAATPGNLHLGDIPVGQSATQTLQLVNLGGPGDPTISLDPAAAQISGTGAGDFAATFAATGPLSLAPGQSTTVTIAFTPSSATQASASLSIPHSGGNSPLSVSLAAAGLPAIPVGFGKTTLSETNTSLPTSLQFGPDGRLYVGQQDGLIHAYDVVRNGPNDYAVSSSETISSIQSLLNHDDDGSLNPSVTSRLITGILVTGTSQAPVIYVTSSDPRIGGGPSGETLDLDTNSGIVSRLTWNGSTWDKLDLVRGLPRSEENHGPNGLQLDPATNTLYVTSGGNTNMGAPSNNFAYLPEFALSAAILAVDLDAIGDTTYDLPTLDDEDRAGVSDANDPFGGNDGKNQALLVPGGPVQVYAPGFRNPYDVVLTSNGRMYSVDNGPNAGWGDVPIGEGPQGNATNQPNEPGVTHGDGLHFVSGPGYYAGHPNPTRSNPSNTFNASNPQSPVTVGNPVESDYLAPGAENGALAVFSTSTNGLVEYTASNFNGAMQGDLLAASFDNSIKRIKLGPSGDNVELSENLFNSVGSVPLDVTAIGDGGPYPGTVWVADIFGDKILVFEPNDYDGSGGDPGDPNDADGDGYTDADELANGTNPNSAADFPPDWDTDFVSNLLDTDDDNDGLPDTSDPFAIDATNGTSTPVGFSYTWENNAPNPGGLLNLGFTGLMTNGADDYETLFDAATLTAGGAAGVLTLDSSGEGDATGNLNTQQQAFQLGVDAAAANQPFSAQTRILAPFAGTTPQGQQSMGLFIGNGDQDNYFKVIVTANEGSPAITWVLEENQTVTGGPDVPINVPGPDAIDFFITVDPASATVQASYAVTQGGTQGPRVDVGAAPSIPPAWLAGSTGLAVGVISTSVGPAPPASVTWDHLKVLPEGSVNVAPVVDPVADQTVQETDTLSLPVTASDTNGDAITLSAAGVPAFASFQDHGDGTGTLSAAPLTGTAGDYQITVTATDNGSPVLTDTETFTLQVTAAPASGSVVYRVNVGGAALSDTVAWEADYDASPSAYGNAGAANSATFSVPAAVDTSDESVPPGTPAQLFQTERWDPPSGAEMQWDFPVTPGDYLVRVYFAEIYSGAQSAGARVFDVAIEGTVLLDDYDVFADIGASAGVVKSFLVTTDTNLDIDLLHVTENPALKGIEILSTSSSSTNTAPTLAPIGDHTVADDAALSVDISASDGDGDGLALTASGLPSFATFQDHGDGTATLSINPSPGDAGTYPVTVTATDDGNPPLSDAETFAIVVTAPVVAGTPVYRVNAGGPAVDGNPPWYPETPDGGSTQDAVRHIGSRLELFVDQYLVDTLTNAQLELHMPQEATSDPNPHGAGAYPSVVYDGTQFHHFFRGYLSGVDPTDSPPPDGTNNEVTRYDTSPDGINWTAPHLDLFNVTVDGVNNVVLANDAPSMHNFVPFYDTNPDADPQFQFKALAGLSHVGTSPAPISGLRAYGSPDGIHWTLLTSQPVITVGDLPDSNDSFAFDSANISFWSETEQKYVVYYRTWTGGSPGSSSSLRAFTRAESTDFINWTNHVDIDANFAGEHLYASMVNPYFRAPHIYTAMPTLFLTNQPQNNTHILFMSSRDGFQFDRTFGQQTFIEGLPGNRQNYVAPLVVQTDTNEMSIYGQSGIRYTLRLDGFASVDTTGTSGELLTRPLTFAGNRLTLNTVTGSSGSVQVELQDADGQPIPGFTLSDSDPLSGDLVDGVVTWNGNSDVSTLAGQVVRVRFVMQDADVFAMQFSGTTSISIPKGEVVTSGQTITLPITLDVAEPGGLSLQSADFAMSFDSQRFQISNVRPGPLAPNFTVNANVDNQAGTLTVNASGPAVSLPVGAHGNVVLMDVTVNPGAVLGASPVNLELALNGTLTAINGGAVTLTPGPTGADDDPVDGRITVTGTVVNAAASSSQTFTTTTPIDMTDASIPPGTPMELFQTERWDATQGEELEYDFPVSPGVYVVRMYFAEIYQGATTPGSRVFDVFIEGNLALDDYDVAADVGGFAGVVKTFSVTSDSNLDIDFGHVVQNPSIKAIEILTAQQAASSQASAAVPASEISFASQFNNSVEPHDVDGDHRVSPGDALAIINRLNQGGSANLDETTAPTSSASWVSAGSKHHYFDVNGDHLVSPLDVLLVINALNRSNGPAATAAGVAEKPAAGERTATASAADGGWSRLATSPYDAYRETDHRPSPPSDADAEPAVGAQWEVDFRRSVVRQSGASHREALPDSLQGHRGSVAGDHGKLDHVLTDIARDITRAWRPPSGASRTIYRR